VEAEGPVAENSNDRRVRTKRLGRDGERDRGADRTGYAVDQPVLGLDDGLRPLSDLAAVADQRRSRVPFEELADDPAELSRVQASFRSRC